MASIYIIHCTISGKKYVGQTKGKVENRIRTHFSKKTTPKNKSPRLYSAMEKYGRENFIWGIVESCEEDLTNQRECDIISKFDTYKSGYNSTPGGSLFKSHSPETKAKMSATWKAKVARGEKMNGCQKGSTQSPESNAKRSRTLQMRKEQGLSVGCPKGTIPWNKKLN